MSDAVTVALIVTVPTTLLAVTNIYLTVKNHAKREKEATEIRAEVEGVRISVNGRLSELLALNKKAANLEGQQEERDSHDNRP
jgi:hypothetical protein